MANLMMFPRNNTNNNKNDGRIDVDTPSPNRTISVVANNFEFENILSIRTSILKIK
jgi:hypothetical protein